MTRLAAAWIVSFVSAALACNAPSRAITNDAPIHAEAQASREPFATSPPTSRPSPAMLSDGRLETIDAAADTDALSLIRTQRLEAKAKGRTLVVYVGAKWCEPCRRFKAEMETGRLDEHLPKTTLLVFDADRDLDRLAVAGYAFQFVPFIAQPGADGRPAVAQQARGKGGDGEVSRELVGTLVAWQRGR